VERWRSIPGGRVLSACSSCFLGQWSTDRARHAFSPAFFVGSEGDGVRRRGTRGYRIWVVERKARIKPGRLDCWEPAEANPGVPAAFLDRGSARAWIYNNRGSDRMRVRSYLRWSGPL